MTSAESTLCYSLNALFRKTKNHEEHWIFKEFNWNKNSSEIYFIFVYSSLSPALMQDTLI